MAVAFFDLDETLIGKDSTNMWVTFMVKRGWAPESALFKQQNLMADYHAGCLDIHAYLDFTLGLIAGWEETLLSQRIAEYIEEVIKPVMYPEGIQRVRWHLDRGDAVLTISASGEYLVRPIAKMFGMEHVVGITHEVVDGKLTGKFIGKLSFKEGKLECTQDWLKEQGLSFEDSYGYSDSNNDRPMLESVTHPHAINADAALRLYATEHGWAIEDWELPV